jgi:hypothetical protein
VDATTLRNFQEFENLCSQVPNVTVATTMWSKVEEETGEQREEQLKTSFWEGMVSNGSRIQRFNDTYESAWNIVGRLIPRAGIPVPVPLGTVDGHRSSKEHNANIPLQVREEPFQIDRDDS